MRSIDNNYVRINFKRKFTAVKWIEFEYDDQLWFRYETWNPYYRHLNEYRPLYEKQYGLKLTTYLEYKLEYDIHEYAPYLCAMVKQVPYTWVSIRII